MSENQSQPQMPNQEMQAMPVPEHNPGNVIGPTPTEIAELNLPAAQERTTWRDAARSKLGRAVAAATLLVTLPGIGHRGETHTEDITTVTPTESTHVVTGEFTETIPMPYARDYETGQTEAGQVAEAAEEIVEDHPEVFDTPGVTVTGVEVEGSASADNNDAEGEFTDHNADNERLAEEERGGLAAIGIGGAIENETGQDVSDVIEISGDEDQWSPGEEERGNELAERFGYGADATEMVNYFETEDADELERKLSAAPDEVAEFIQRNIIDKQSADVTVRHSQEITVPGVSVETKKKTVSTETTVLTDANPEGFMPEQPVAPVQPEFDYKIKKDQQRGQPDWQRIKGQKPIRHRGRTHMTGPHY